MTNSRVFYPPSQKATGFKTVDECEGGYPSKLISSVVGYASEGSACLREAASAKAGPTKHVEEPWALARGAPLDGMVSYAT